jgi:hypothetical protein
MPTIEDLIKTGESDWEIVTRTNFAQEWAWEAVEAKQEQTKEKLPEEYQ